MKNARLKHNKIKNSGIIWELLVRQLTNDILNENNNSPVRDIIRKYFNKKTEIYKEYLLYKVLLNTKIKYPSLAEELIKETQKTASNINYKKLNIEKYNLIKELKDLYDIKEFFKTSIPNYVVYASAFKLLKLVETPDIETDIGEISLIKETLINNILTNKTPKIHLKEHKKNDYIIDNLTFKLLIENFNKKYKYLNNRQKYILKLFIENPIESIELKNKITESLDDCNKRMINILKEIDDKVIKIKIHHILDNMKNTKSKLRNNIMKSSIINNILLFEQLYDELEKLKG